MSESHHEIEEEVMEEMGIEESHHTKLIKKIVLTIVVIAAGIGISFAINWYISKPEQPSKTERFLDSVEQIQKDIHQMTKDENIEAQNSKK